MSTIGERLGLADYGQSEINRLTKIVRKQGAEKRRLQVALDRLREEKRSTYELHALLDQQAEAIKQLDQEIARLQESTLVQATENMRRSRIALGVRYGRIYGALVRLLNDPAVVEDARQAIRDVHYRDWVRAELRARGIEP